MTGCSLDATTPRARGAIGRATAAALALVSFAALATAEPLEPVPPLPAYTFDIPSQQMETALQRYSSVTGVEVLYENRIAKGLQSAAVSGRLSAHQGLLALLGGADIAVGYAGSKAVTLVRRSEDSAAGAGSTPELSLDPLDVTVGSRAADDASLKLYGQAVQTDVEGRLRRDSRTRAGAYRAEIALWIDPSRTVRRAVLARTTGDAERDAAIVEALNGLVVRKPAPPQAAQPVRLLVTVKAR